MTCRAGQQTETALHFYRRRVRLLCNVLEVQARKLGPHAVGHLSGGPAAPCVGLGLRRAPQDVSTLLLAQLLGLAAHLRGEGRVAGRCRGWVMRRRWAPARWSALLKHK